MIDPPGSAGAICLNCRFYGTETRMVDRYATLPGSGQREQDFKVCRRYPQVVDKRETDWCGEHSG